MPLKRWICCWILTLLCCLLPSAVLGEGQTRALLIGVDEFVSRPSAAPSSANNVRDMQQLLAGVVASPDHLSVPSAPVTDADTLQTLLQSAFAGAQETDLNLLYLSTHGVYEPGKEPMLLLSDGIVEYGLTPSALKQCFEGIQGTKLIILDACNSGAFIGKGMPFPMENPFFRSDDFKVLASCGALEESWYWNSGAQGAFYFTQALIQSLSAANGYPADQNRDGAVTLSELYDALLISHAASTPQVYPQQDDTVVFRYDASAPLPSGLDRSPIMDVTFSGTVLDSDQRQLSIEFIATRPVRVAYQIVYQQDGKWAFDNAQLIYDGAERFTAFGDEPGAISAGRKLRTVNLSKLSGKDFGYVLVQLVSIDEGRLTVHAGRVICVPPQEGDMNLTAWVESVFHTKAQRELSIFIGHDFPCALSVAIVDEQEQVVARLCHRQSTRPLQITPSGSVFYWNGLRRDGTPAEPGTYRVRAQAHLNNTSITVLSSAFTIE